MTTYYVISNDGKQLIPQVSGYPIINITGMRASSLNSFISELNFTITWSAEYRSNLMHFGTEGIEVNLIAPHVQMNPGPGYAPYTPTGEAGFAVYPRNSQGTFANNPNIPFEPKIFILSDQGARDIVITLGHEIGHPRFGIHSPPAVIPTGHDPVIHYWNYIVNDPVYASDHRIVAQSGVAILIDDPFWASHIGVTNGTWVMTQAGKDAELARNPGSNPNVTIVSEDTFHRIMAVNLAKVKAGRFLKLGTPQSKAERLIVDASGRARYVEAKELSIQNLSDFSQIGSIIGSSLGNHLAGGNVVKGVIYSSILGEIGERLGFALAGGPAGRDMGTLFDAAVAPSFLPDVFQRMQSAGIGAVSSMFAGQLAQSLGLDGFGGQLFSVTVSTGTNAVINQVIQNITDKLPSGALNLDTKTFDGVFSGDVLSNGAMWASAIGAFVGTKLGAMVVAPETQAAVVLSSIGSAIGSYFGAKQGALIGASVGGPVGALIGGFLGAAFGAFRGFVFWSLIGNLFGKKKKIRLPTANAETVLQVPYARYEVGAATSANGGNLDLAKSMAANARDILNGFIQQITYGDDKAYVSNVNGYNTTQAYGHTNSQLYVRVNGVQKNVNSADEAVEYGTLAAIRNTKVVGGDLFLKRAVLSSTAQDLLAFSGDLQTARDYAFYGSNRELINGYIKDAFASLGQADKDFYNGANKTLVDDILNKGVDGLSEGDRNTYNNNKAQFDRVIAAVGAQTVANPWIVTLMRASELKLDQWATSDFYGGLQGFLQSMGVNKGKAYFEDANFRISGATGATISVRTPGSTTGVFDVLPQALSGPDSNDIRDGRFQDLSASNWEWAVWNPANVWTVHGVNLNADWSGNGNDVLWAHMSGYTAGQIVDHYSEWMPSTAGVVYESSVYAAQHRSSGEMAVVFYDANKNVISEHRVWGAREYGGQQGKLENYNLLQNTVKAPPGTAYRRLQLRMYTIGGQDPHAFFTRPFSRAVNAANDVADSNFSGYNETWSAWSNTDTNLYRGVNHSPDWGTGSQILWTAMSGFPADKVSDHRSQAMATKGGATYEFSVYAAQHRSQAEMWVEYFDENFNWITARRIGGFGRESGAWQGKIENFDKISGTDVAPANAAYRKVLLRMYTNGQEAPHAWFTMPTSREVTAGTPNWEDRGHSVYIDQMNKVGYGAAHSVTAGNDYVDRSGWVNGTLIDDYSEQQVWVNSGYPQWNGYDYDWIDDSHWETQAVTGGDDIFVGGQGNDVLRGRDGWDWLEGGAGRDELDGGNQNDVLIGGEGVDRLLGGDGDDYLAGGDGYDRWEQNETPWGGLWGGNGNDTLVGGAGSDFISGDEGDDLFIIDQDAGLWDHMEGGNGSDTASFERFIQGPGEYTAIIDMRWIAPWTTDNNAKLIYGDYWYSIENATGSEFRDYIVGDIAANVLKGLGGNDFIHGWSGADVIEGGAGADDLWGGSDAGEMDTVSYAGSSSGVYVDLSSGQTFGGDAEGDTIHEFENIRGSRLADELKGDAGTNTIEGLDGDDWIVATAGGEQVYVDYDDYDYYNPYYRYYQTSYWTGGDVYNGGLGKDTVDYSEATSGITVYLGSYTATSASGGSGSAGLAVGHSLISIEAVVGSQYADSLSAGAGAQTFEGGKGNDYLAGGAGADTYLFSRGDGSDTVNESNDGSNTLSLAGDIKFSDLYIASSGGGGGFLDIGIRGTGDVVRFNGNFADSNTRRLQVLDMNGAGQLDLSGITFEPPGRTDGNDTINGWTNQSDFALGFNGDDYITGSGSNTEYVGNVFIGGLGNDTLKASMGDDQFAYDRGDGTDSIIDSGGEDTIVFGSTVAADDVIYEIDVYGHLWIGLKEENAALTASQVSSKIRVNYGGTLYHVQYYNDYSGYRELVREEDEINTVEFILAGGTSIDIRKLNLSWKEVVTERVTYHGGYAPPIVLDLDGDGLDLSEVDSSTIITRNDRGGLYQLAWVGPTDAFLAVDRDGDGAINKVSELSFVQDKAGATSDLEGLKTWDTNGDGLLDKNDANFGKLLLFQDLNQNGRSTKKELRTLAEAGIVAIDLKGVATGYTSKSGTDSYVQNTLNFIWADGTKGDAYDVALAHRALGSDGLYSGEYQSEWGGNNFDAEIGQLKNDAKAAAKTARVKQKKAVLDRIGATYQEIKAQAQVDFSDHDRIDAKIMKRWEKLNKSERAAWLAGQATDPGDRIRKITAQQALYGTQVAGQKATEHLMSSAYEAAATSVSAVNTGGSGTTGLAQAQIAGGTGAAQTGFGLSLTASEPVSAAPQGSVSGSGATSQAWWRQEAADLMSQQASLGALLAAMDGYGPDSIDPATSQQQALLRQSMAGFGGHSGGSSPAVWSRDSISGTAPMAASTGLQKTSPVPAFGG